MTDLSVFHSELGRNPPKWFLRELKSLFSAIRIHLSCSDTIIIKRLSDCIDRNWFWTQNRCGCSIFALISFGFAFFVWFASLRECSKRFHLLYWSQLDSVQRYEHSPNLPSREIPDWSKFRSLTTELRSVSHLSRKDTNATQWIRLWLLGSCIKLSNRFLSA